MRKRNMVAAVTAGYDFLSFEELVTFLKTRPIIPRASITFGEELDHYGYPCGTYWVRFLDSTHLIDNKEAVLHQIEANGRALIDTFFYNLEENREKIYIVVVTYAGFCRDRKETYKHTTQAKVFRLRERAVEWIVEETSMSIEGTGSVTICLRDDLVLGTTENTKTYSISELVLE